MSKYPSGYRFNPTDEEIIIHYLLPKIFGQPLPDVNLPMVTINKYPPETLIKEFGDSERFMENQLIIFVSRLQKYNKGRRPNRITDGGFWKPTGIDKKIMDGNGRRIGSRTHLDYYEGVQGEASCRRTLWKMHEYFPYSVNDNDSQKFQKLVLCKIYLNSRNKDNEDMGGFVVASNSDDRRSAMKEETTEVGYAQSQNNNTVVIHDPMNNNNGDALPYGSFSMEQPNNINDRRVSELTAIAGDFNQPRKEEEQNGVYVQSQNYNLGMAQDTCGFALPYESSRLEQPNNAVQLYDGNYSNTNAGTSTDLLNNNASTSSNHFIPNPLEETYPSSSSYQMYRHNNFLGHQSSLIRGSEYLGNNLYNNHSQNPPTNGPVVRYAQGTCSILGCPITYNVTTSHDQNHNT